MYSSRMTSDGVLRIGELSKRAGVSPELLRAWERRYGLLRPTRSGGGLRLYSPADVERVRLMRQHLAEGVAAAEAAAMALRAGVGDEAAPAALDPAVMRDDLAAALDRFDEPRARPSSRPRSTLEAKCSCAIDASPRSQRSPSSRR